jgi:hypothetical protein
MYEYINQKKNIYIYSYKYKITKKKKTKIYRRSRIYILHNIKRNSFSTNPK